MQSAPAFVVFTILSLAIALHNISTCFGTKRFLHPTPQLGRQKCADAQGHQILEGDTYFALGIILNTFE